MRPAMPALLVLAGLACLAALWTATAHDPTPGFPGEGVGYPGAATYIYGGTGVFDMYEFHGPSGTVVDSTPCENAETAAPDPGTGHIGHISAVQNLQATTAQGTPRGIALGSIAKWHFGLDQQYEIPATIENNGIVSANGIMLYTDGYFIGEWQDVMTPDPSAAEIQITDVHLNSAYCVYLAPDDDADSQPDGPWIFVDSTYNDGSVNLMELSDWFVPLYNQFYTDNDPHATMVMFIASVFDDPSPPPLEADAFGPYNGAQGVPIPITGTGVNGVPGYTCVWSGLGVTFSNANSCNTSVTLSINCPTLSATATITLQVTDSYNQVASDTATVGVTRTCPPSVSFIWSGADTCLDTLVSFDANNVNDPDGGAIVSWVWTFGDGSPAVTTTNGYVQHQYAAIGTYPVHVTVTDDDGETASFGPLQVNGLADYNCPPTINAPSRITVIVGSSVSFIVSGDDPEPDFLTFSVTGLPVGATFNPLTGAFSWRPGLTQTGLTCMTFSVTDGIDVAVAFTCINVMPESYDSDHDGIADDQDNCLDVANPSQSDTDQDRLGDACDERPTVADVTITITRGDADNPAADQDRDGVADDQDNCPGTANASQLDGDADGLGDLCDSDADGDLVVDAGAPGILGDNCPTKANPDQADGDGDGVGDACRAPVPLAQSVRGTDCATCAGAEKPAAAGANKGSLYLGVGIAVVVGVLGASLLVVAIKRREGA